MDYDLLINNLNEFLDILFEDRVDASLKNDYFREIEIARQISNTKNLINYIKKIIWHFMSIIILFNMEGGHTHIDNIFKSNLSKSNS